MKDVLRYGLPWIFLIAVLFMTRLSGIDTTGYLVPFILGLLAAYYFNLNNPHPTYQKHVTIAMLFWLFAFQIRREFYPIIDLWLPAIAAAIFSYVYFQRFKSREEKLWIDNLKLIGVLALVPSTYLDLIIAPIVTFYICLFLTFIFLLDRLIIRKKMNKTTQIIVFSLMTLVCFSFLIYSFIKSDEATKSRIISEEQGLEAVRLQKMAVELQLVAQEAAAEAKRQEAISLELKEALEICKSR